MRTNPSGTTAVSLQGPPGSPGNSGAAGKPGNPGVAGSPVSVVSVFACPNSPVGLLLGFMTERFCSSAFRATRVPKETRERG